jgi:hypothetical protein
MSIVIKTLACGSLTNGNCSNGSNTKSMHARQNTGGGISSKKVMVNLTHFLLEESQIFGICNEKFYIDNKYIYY